MEFALLAVLLAGHPEVEAAAVAKECLYVAPLLGAGADGRREHLDVRDDRIEGRKDGVAVVDGHVHALGHLRLAHAVAAAEDDLLALVVGAAPARRLGDVVVKLLAAQEGVADRLGLGQAVYEGVMVLEDGFLAPVVQLGPLAAVLGDQALADRLRVEEAAALRELLGVGILAGEAIGAGAALVARHLDVLRMKAPPVGIHEQVLLKVDRARAVDGAGLEEQVERGVVGGAQVVLAEAVVALLGLERRHSGLVADARHDVLQPDFIGTQLQSAKTLGFLALPAVVQLLGIGRVDPDARPGHVRQDRDQLGFEGEGLLQVFGDDVGKLRLLDLPCAQGVRLGVRADEAGVQAPHVLLGPQAEGLGSFIQEALVLALAEPALADGVQAVAVHTLLVQEGVGELDVPDGALGADAQCREPAHVVLGVGHDPAPNALGQVLEVRDDDCLVEVSSALVADGEVDAGDSVAE